MAKESKRKREVRNKARDVITDYYRTGREYSKENRKRQEESSSKEWKTSEKVMLAIIIIAAIGCIIRYFILKI